MAKPKSTVWLALLGLALALGGAWWWQQQPRASGVSGSADAAPAPRSGGGAGPVTVEIAAVKTARLQDDAQAVGSLRSRQAVTLKPETAGRVARIAFADGQSVRRGALLVQLDDTLQRAELNQAAA